MRVTIWKGGEIVNIVVSKTIKGAADLHPGYTAKRWTEGDVISSSHVAGSSTGSAEAALYKECLDIITGEAE
jgi:hypothetical protein